MVQTLKNEILDNPGRGTSQVPPPPSKYKEKKRIQKKLVKNLLFISPAFLIYSIFMLIPLIGSIKISFYSTTGVGEAVFVGLKNYHSLFFNEAINERFTNAFMNNIKSLMFTMIFQNMIALFLAILLNRGLRFFKIIRTVIFIPVTMSIVLVGYIWTLLLNPNWGALNVVLTKIGLESWALPWLGNENTALLTVSLVSSWQFIGLAIMFFLAGIQNIPDELYEAAEIDGASAWNKFTHITIPQLNSIFGIVIILTLVGNFSQFELIYSMEGTQAGPNYSTDVLGTFFYRTAFSSSNGTTSDLGLGATISTVSFLFVFILVSVWLYLTQWKKK